MFDTIENFFFWGLCVMNCSHEPNVLKVERRRHDYVDINFIFQQQTNSTQKEYEFPFI